MEELRCVALACYLLKVHAAEGRLCDARCASDADSPSPLEPEALTRFVRKHLRWCPRNQPGTPRSVTDCFCFYFGEVLEWSDISYCSFNASSMPAPMLHVASAKVEINIKDLTNVCVAAILNISVSKSASPTPVLPARLSFLSNDRRVSLRPWLVAFRARRGRRALARRRTTLLHRASPV